MSYKLMVSSFAFILLSLLTAPVSAQSTKSTRGQHPTTKTSQPQQAKKQNTVKHLDKLDLATTYQIWTEWYKAQEQGIKLPVPTININVNDEKEYNRLVAIWKQGQVKAEEDFRLRLAQAAKAKESAQLSDGGETDLTDQPPASAVTNINSITTVANPIQSPFPGFNRPKGIAGVLAATTSPMVNPNPAPIQPSPVNAVAANNNGILDDLRKKEITANIAKAKAIADAANPMALSGANVSTKYLVDTNNVTGLPQVIEESQYVNGVLATVKQYTYGADGLISQRQLINGQWVTSFFIKDGHGSIRMLTDVNGNVTDTYDYDAFGNLVNITGNTPNNRLYAGEEFDLDLGFYYLRARYLNQATGRFFTQDSYEGDIEEPTSLHKYLYTENDPVNNVDPTGLSTTIDQAASRTGYRIISARPVIQFKPTIYSATKLYRYAAYAALGVTAVDALGKFFSIPQTGPLPSLAPSNYEDTQDYSNVTKPCDHYNNPNPIFRAIPNPFPPYPNAGIPHALDNHSAPQNSQGVRKSYFFNASRERFIELFVQALILGRLNNNFWSYEQDTSSGKFRCVLYTTLDDDIGKAYDLKHGYTLTPRYKLVANSAYEGSPALVTMYPVRKKK